MITFRDIYAWERIYETKLESFVIDMLLRMDAAFLEEHYKK